MLTDVIKRLNLDIVIVASSLLGTINSTVLTVEYAKKLNIAVKGVIMNYFDENDFMHMDNKKQIKKFTGVPVIASVSKNSQDIGAEAEVIKRLYKEV
jgi:dethiobiotin synthetase